MMLEEMLKHIPNLGGSMISGESEELMKMEME